jgi:hypothetical protein
MIFTLGGIVLLEGLWRRVNARGYPDEFLSRHGGPAAAALPPTRCRSTGSDNNGPDTQLSKYAKAQICKEPGSGKKYCGQ